MRIDSYRFFLLNDSHHLTVMKPLGLTISSHGPHVRSVHHPLVLLGESFDVAFAQVQDLHAELGAALVRRPLLDGEVQQHHAPDEAETHQEEAQLLGRQLPVDGGHAEAVACAAQDGSRLMVRDLEESVA